MLYKNLKFRLHVLFFFFKNTLSRKHPKNSKNLQNLDEHTQLLEDEIHRLRRKVVRADELEQKLNRIQTLLPPILHIGAPVKERKIRKPIDVLLDDVVKVLRDSKQKGSF